MNDNLKKLAKFIYYERFKIKSNKMGCLRKMNELNKKKPNTPISRYGTLISNLFRLANQTKQQL